MISHVTGQLADVHGESVVLERAGVGYTVAVPQYSIGELAACRGREVTLHTLLFLEGNQTGGHIEPQLIGFMHPEDKHFFRRFISVKGIGVRKALKALTDSPGHIATWIEDGDVQALKQLPGIGARAAELIVAELKGKVGDHALAASTERGIDASRFSQAQRDALEIMIALGDGRSESEQWLERAGQLATDVETPDEWLRAAYKVKTGACG